MAFDINFNYIEITVSAGTEVMLFEYRRGDTTELVDTDWGDGTVSSDLFHTYKNAGTYTIKSQLYIQPNSDNIEIQPYISYTVNRIYMFNHNMKDLSRFFQGLTLNSIEDVANWDLSNVTDISYMFLDMTLRQNTSMNYISEWNVSNVTNMDYLFSNCKYINADLDLSKWNVSNVKSMRYLFALDVVLDTMTLDELGDDPFASVLRIENEDIESSARILSESEIMNINIPEVIENVGIPNINNWDFSNVENISNMFENNTNLVSVNIGNWNFSKLDTCSRLFSCCTSLTTLNLNTPIWSNLKLRYINHMFYGCTNLTILDLSNLDLSRSTSLLETFCGCELLTSIGDTNNWNTSNITTMNKAFSGCSNLKELGTTNWDVRKVTTFANMFEQCKSLVSINATNWVTDSLKTIGSMFSGCNELVSIGDIGNWNVINVQSAIRLFNNCKNLEYIGDLSRWKVNSMTDMSHMFYYCNKLKTPGNLSKWNVSKVKNFTYIFYRCSLMEDFSFLKKWNMSNAANINYMFSYTPIKDISWIGSWKLKNIENIRYVFANCTSLTNTDGLSDIKFGNNIKGSASMFSSCSKIKNLDLSSLDISSATTISNMFNKCTELESLKIKNIGVSSSCTKSSVFSGSNNLVEIEMLDDCNIDQLNVILSILPDRSGKEPGTLTIRYVGDKSNIDLGVANNKNWYVILEKPKAELFVTIENYKESNLYLKKYINNNYLKTDHEHYELIRRLKMLEDYVVALEKDLDELESK